MALFRKRSAAKKTLLIAASTIANTDTASSTSIKVKARRCLAISPFSIYFGVVPVDPVVEPEVVSVLS
jgi:hypothetical protein